MVSSSRLVIGRGEARWPAVLRAACSASSMAIVIGPDAAGHGGDRRGDPAAPSKSTSPQSVPSGRWLMPTSMTTAPGLIQSAVRTPARPIATISMSAWRVIEAGSSGSRVADGHGGVAPGPFCIRIRASGLPTISAPEDDGMCSRASGLRVDEQLADAERRARQEPRNPSARQARLIGWKPSTSLAGVDRSMIARPRRSARGRGSCTRMPWTAGSALSRSIEGEQLGLAGRRRAGGAASCSMPTCSHALALVADVDLAGGVVADEHNRQSGYDPAFVPEPGNIASQLFADLLGQGFPIEERRGHCGFPENG